jgi:hypothetical protein
MEAWISALRASPPQPPDGERLALEFWQAYRPGWIVGLSKTPHGWKAQVSAGMRILQKRFGRTASLIEMLTWRDAQREQRPERVRRRTSSHGRD